MGHSHTMKYHETTVNTSELHTTISVTWKNDTIGIKLENKQIEVMYYLGMNIHIFFKSYFVRSGKETELQRSSSCLSFRQNLLTAFSEITERASNYVCACVYMCVCILPNYAVGSTTPHSVL